MVEILSDSLYSIEAIVAGEKSSRNNTFQIPGSRVTTARFDKKMADFISNETIRIRLIVNLQIATIQLEMMYRHLDQKFRQ